MIRCRCPSSGQWHYRRLPDGGLVQAAPTVCPRGHELGPYRASLHWHPGRRATMVCCRACYETDPMSGMFLPAEPVWMERFHDLVAAHRTREAMAVINEALPPLATETRTGRPAGR